MSKRVPGYGVGLQPDDRHRLAFEPSPRRVRVLFGGQVVADSTRAMLLLETDHLPVYYLPDGDLLTDAMRRTELTTRCPYKGKAVYWSITVNGRTAENAVWAYPEPAEGAPSMAGYRAFVWNAMDMWLEEDEQIFVHPRDPYKRVDVLYSSRHVKVMVGDVLVADSRRPVVVFETGLPPRYYLPHEDVRTHHLVPSPTVTRCPYKGLATTWSVRVAERLLVDEVWTYQHPIIAPGKLTGRLAFIGSGASLLVDGEPVS